VTGNDGEWTRMSADASVPSGGYLFSGEPFVMSADDRVTSLSVLVDEQGTYYVDDVQVAGETLGEPRD
jgi:hypothetical protein